MSLQRRFPASSAAINPFCPLRLCVISTSAPSAAPLLDSSVLSSIIILSNSLVFIGWESRRLTALEILFANIVLGWIFWWVFAWVFNSKAKNNHYERFKFNMYLRMWRTQFSLLFLRPTFLTFVCRRLCLPCRREAWTNRLTMTAKTLLNRSFHVITPHPRPPPVLPPDPHVNKGI